MKTSELITALTAAGADRARPAPSLARIAPAAIGGVLLALVILNFWLGMQPLSAAIEARWFWMKALYCAGLAGAGLLILLPSVRPGAKVGVAGLVVLGLAIAGIGMMAGRALTSTPEALWPRLWLGDTWRVCPWRILALAAPIYALLLSAARARAPTRLAIAGAAAGLLAGGLAGLVYGLYCQEYAAPFVAAWYSLGIGVCAGLGALIATKALRW